MALTESEIIDALTILGVPVRSDVAFALSGENSERSRDSDICRRALSMASADQATKIKAVIAQWTAVQFDTDRINAQGLDSDPGRARKRLAGMLGNLIGYTPRSTAWPTRIGRG